MYPGSFDPASEKNAERQHEPEEHEEVGAKVPRRQAREPGKQQARPGKEPAEQQRQVVPGRSRVPVDGAREPLDVVVEQEDVHEVLALVTPDEEVPGARDQHEGEQAER